MIRNTLLTRNPLLIWIVLLSGMLTVVHAQTTDSLHIRNPDSTRIIIDTETVPVSVRSRAHQLTSIFPIGFFPREETGVLGFWQKEINPQYFNEFYVNGIPVTSRLRPEVPLRYVPQHSIIGFDFFRNKEVVFPPRLHLLEREDEPMVNIGYKQGFYQMNALSIGMAADITDALHLHLAKEGQSYVGQYGLDGIQNDRYYGSIHHRADSSSSVIYSTFYSKDQLNWTSGLPAPRAFGRELSSWYQHLLMWQNRWLGAKWNYGLQLGSHRLWLKGESVQDELNELQRGMWIQLSDSLAKWMSYQLQYTVMRYDLDTEAGGAEDELWQTVRFGLDFGSQNLTFSPALTVKYPNLYLGTRFLLPDIQLDLPLFHWLRWQSDIESDIDAVPWEWQVLEQEVNNQRAINEVTQVHRYRSALQVGVSDWFKISLSGEYLEYQDYYRLLYQSPIAQTDSALALDKIDGNMLFVNSEISLNPADWLELGGAYFYIPSADFVAPEFWSTHGMKGWAHIKRYFFNNNLLAHVFVEGGVFLERNPIGWNPMLQSMTYYPNGLLPNPLNYLHANFIGEVGPFTISASIYNALGTNFQYAVDQRPHTSVFYLGIRWQFWD